MYPRLHLGSWRFRSPLNNGSRPLNSVCGLKSGVDKQASLTYVSLVGKVKRTGDLPSKIALMRRCKGNPIIS